MRVIVTGLIATYPAGGVAWDYGQYLLGLASLGFEVVYLEDTGTDVYDVQGRSYSPDPGGGVRFLHDTLDRLFPDRPIRWHLRAPDGRTFGTSPEEIRGACSTADLFVNVSGGTLLREEYAACGRTVLIDTDPGLNHYVNYPRMDLLPGWEGALSWREHTHHFTYAELLGTPRCRLPALGIGWRATRPPVHLGSWRPEPPGTDWTTVMSWGSYSEVPPIVDDEGRPYYAKEPEFPLIEQLPLRRPEQRFVVAVKPSAPVERWQRQGWRHRDPDAVIPDPHAYRRYVQSSRGELSIAKNVYVATRSGWFSCRSGCYLAAGRPVVTQDTGFAELLPTGEGLLAFSTEQGALEAIDAVESDYERHTQAARALAEEHLSTDVVLTRLLREVGL